MSYLYNKFMEQSEFLKVALDASRKAAEVIRHYYSPDIRITLKADQSPVTIADQEAEKIIIKTLKASFPDHSFLGEESGQQDLNQDYLWFIDPTDATKIYTRQVPFFASVFVLTL